MSSTTDTPLRVHDTLTDSVVDGPGLRYVVFFQGCRRGCPGCHNPGTHDPDGGRPAAVPELIREIEKNPILQGVTLSGGEPFLQAGGAAALARAVRALGVSRGRPLDVWCYTGLTWEELTAPQAGGASPQTGALPQTGGALPQMGGALPEWGELLRQVDVLVDGPFMQEHRSLELLWRGSGNQRLIDVPASLRDGRIIEYKEV